ncbi:hypothetical protein PG990_008123 [Apiospora arundinis]
MASFGKFSTSLIQGVNENTLALANLNFDFSLVKVQAPAEFQQIGPALAEKRRQNAEGGTSHQTARKLGALFEALVPAVPGVISKYGERASQIMRKPEANPSGSTKKHGPFAAFVGADATGIWAAATSGHASIAIHLLACMLVRTFDDPAKAVSVWVELVDDRKKEIMAYDARSSLSMAEMAALNASSQQVTRDELRLWDASARAWLQTADSAMRKEHIQLNLILKNLSIPVIVGNSLYASVTKAWTQALVGIERLIAGEPQSVTNGAILLAISAWHLYPDLLVFSSETKPVEFSDPLMNPSGVLTVGITNSTDASTNKEGIYWSVALSHYRHYGRPTKVVSKGDDRLTIDELYLVTLGGILKSWDEPRVNFERAAEWFVALWRCVHRAKPILPGPMWMEPLAEAASRFLDAKGESRKELKSLLDFGYRRGGQFLVPKTRDCVNLPWFGLRNPHIINPLRQSSAKECGIEYLRGTAVACELDPYHALIIVIGTNPTKKTEQHDYYTAWPVQNSSRHSQATIWTSPTPFVNSFLDELYHDSGSASKGKQPTKRSCKTGRNKIDNLTRTMAGVESITLPFFHANYKISKDEVVSNCHGTLPALSGFSESTLHFAAVVGEESESFSLWFGQQDLDTLNASKAIQRLRQGKSQSLIDLENSTKILENGVNRYLMWQYLEGADPYDPDDEIKPVLDLMRSERGYWRKTVRSLKSLATAYETYKKLEGATISSTIVPRGIHDAKWALSDSETTMTRSKVFSCIAMMETGTVNLEAEKLEDVLALASGNSIYILRHFVTDPAIEVPPAGVVRIVGNVGRAGISLLVPPASQPLIRPLSNSLRAVEYADFDGRREDNFASTSLHLSFTPYEFPLDYGVTGIIDHQIFFVESVISVHESGKWVADLDILGPFYDGARKILKFQKKVPQGRGPKKLHEHSEEKKESVLGSFVSIDTWEEVLDTPPTHSFVRASDNWAARLAVVAVILQNPCREPNITGESDNSEAEDDDGNEAIGELETQQMDRKRQASLTEVANRVRVAVLENREDVCWVCVHNRLTKMGWLPSHEPCFIVA